MIFLFTGGNSPLGAEQVQIAEQYLKLATEWAVQAGLATISGMLVLSFVISIFRGD